MANGDPLDRWSKMILQLGLPTVFAAVLLVCLVRLLHVLDVMVTDLRAQTQAIQTIERLLESQEKK
jgi:hypothetical protein